MLTKSVTKQAFREFLVSPDFISNLNVHKTVGRFAMLSVKYWRIFYVHLSVRTLV